MATGIENLKIYNMAKELELEVHRILDTFPREEKFRSIDQLNRSSSSITNNIAESYYKKSVKDRMRILRDIVIGELEETRTNLLRCSKKGFLIEERAKILSDKYIELRKAVFGYIRFLRTYASEKGIKLINSSTHQLIN